MTIKELKNYLRQLAPNTLVREIRNPKPHPQLENAVVFDAGIVKIPKEKILDVVLSCFEDDDNSLFFTQYKDKIEKTQNFG
jgi:hypothetical protein